MSQTEAKNARSKAKFNRAKAKAKAKVKSKAKAKAKSVRRRLSFGAKCEQESQADDGLPQTQFESAEAHGVPQAENAPEQLQPAELERHGPCEFQAGNDAEVVQPPSGLPPDRPAEAPVRPRKFELPDEPRPASSSSAAAPSDRKSIFERRPNQHQSPTALQGITPPGATLSLNCDWPVAIFSSCFVFGWPPPSFKSWVRNNFCLRVVCWCHGHGHWQAISMSSLPDSQIGFNLEHAAEALTTRMKAVG